MPWPQVSYAYDGTFPGFLTCVYESYVNRERPACFSAPGEVQLSLYPERAVATHATHARRVLASLPGKLSPAGARLVRRAFLTCLPQREKHIYDFIALGYERGPSVARDLTAPQVSTLVKAVTHLEGEAQLYRGFVRFSDVGGVLAGEIEPKNDVLSLLRPHFCSRYPDDPFVLYDRTHKKALFSQAGRWAILPLEEFHLSAPDAAEEDYRALWRRFYTTIAIAGRENSKCRMTHMPKRYWGCMTEFQSPGADAAPSARP